MSRKQHVRRGGDFFGEGTYGCTFSPPPACSDEEQIAPRKRHSKKLIGKVFEDEESYDKEWEIAKKLAKVDPNQQIFLYPISKCITTLNDIKKDPQASKCSYVSTASPKSSRSNTSFPMVNMVKGGITLEEFVRKNKVSPSKFLKTIVPILKGLIMLKRHNLIHHDLKFDNILYDPHTNETKVIDFGLLVPLKGAFNVMDNDYLYSNYWLHPPEYMMFQCVNDYTQTQLSSLTREEARNFAENSLITLNINFASGDRHTLKDIIINQCFKYHCEYEDAYVNYMLAVAKRPSKSAAIAYMSKQASKIDIYSLGITMAYLSMFLEYKSNHQKKKLMEIIKQFVHPDPRKRPTPAKALTIIENTTI